MTYFVLFLGACLSFGGLAVASNPSPYYGVIGLVVGSIAGCGWLVSLGVSFMGVVLFMIYLGGMLVVFVYSASLAADLFPEAWGDWRVLGYSGGLILVLVVGVVTMGVGDWKTGVGTTNWGGMSLVRGDFGGVAELYSSGVGMFLVAGWGLLLTLFVVLELVRGLSWGAIRAV
uniref:NADH-ubiquinone oxidoreductase chain 6 n=1 Tax=Nyctyornis amictus TaxID=457351 RepID=A0A3G2LKU5_9AVES|nr:NADH dehydrogenase subunit 6 [Nyctyornis amictus]